MSDGYTDQDRTMEILKQILCRLEESGASYAIIHGVSEEPDIRSDVDIAFENDPREVLDPILKNLVKEGVVRVIQCLYYEIPWGFYYILQAERVYPPQYLHLDCLYDPHGINRYRIPTTELLSNRIRESWGYRSADEKSAIYLLAKKSVKGVLTSEVQTMLRRCFAGPSVVLWSDVKTFFGVGAEENIVNLLEANNPIQMKRHLKPLRRLLDRNFRLHHPFLFFLRLLTQSKRLLLRMVYPTGLFVVLLGPDGCGKSTLARGVEEDLARAYRKCWRFHWRPGMLPKPSHNSSSPTSSTSNPPKTARYGTTVSLFRFLYYLTDFVLGYWFVIYPKLVRTTLVLGERWYYDIIVNPQRYGFKLPRWLLSVCSKLVASPDLVMLLAADPASIVSRKPELSEKEIRDQITQFRSLTSNTSVSKEIKTSGAIADSLQELEDTIIFRTAERTNHQQHIYSVDEWKGFPSKRKVKVWISRSDTFKNALQLYQPYSFWGRCSKQMVAALPGGVGRLISRGGNVSGPQHDELLFYTEVIRQILSDPNLVVSFSRGTPGPHQKLTAQATRGQRPFSYIKIGKGSIVGNLLDHENAALEKLEATPLKPFKVPCGLARIQRGDTHFLFLSAPDRQGKERPLLPDIQDLNFLVHEIPADPCLMPVHTVLNQFEYNGLETGLLAQAKHFLAKSGVQDHVLVGPAHGDYVPWNTLTLEDGSLYVYDWEYSTNFVPLMVDLFHRILMPSRLVLQMEASRIIAQLLNLPSDPLLGAVIERSRIPAGTFPGYLLLYLLRQQTRAIGTNEPFSEFLEECIREILRGTNARN